MRAQRPILLVNPPWISPGENIWHGIKGAMPPLSLLSIGAVLERANFRARVLDVHLHAMTEAEVRDHIARVRPSVLGLTMMTSTSIPSHRIARIAKEVDPSIVVVAGGVHVSALPEETLRNDAIDFAVRGDGEHTMLEICEGKPLEEIRGLSFRRNGQVVHNPDRPLMMNLSELPPYAYHLVPMRKYYPAVGAYRRLPAINMLMTRGCPGKCVFCNSAESTLRTRDASLVVEEIEYLRDVYGIREIQFYDDTFTVNKANALEFCRLMTERNVGVTFSCFARADCFSDKMALALKKAGCHQVMFGVESGSPEILRVIRKTIDLERTRKAVAMAKRAGIEVRAAFVLGMPGETRQTVQETIDYAMRLDPDLAVFNIATPYPGTQLYDWALAEGRLTTDDWWDYELGHLVVDFPGIKGDEVIEAYQRAYQVFYQRPRKYWQRLKKIRSYRHLLDSVEAFLHMALKVKVTSRGRYQQEWLRHQRQDFFDHTFDPDVVRLPTSDVYRKAIKADKEVDFGNFPKAGNPLRIVNSG